MPPKRFYEKDIVKMTELYNSGKTTNEIAQEFLMDSSHVCRLLNKNGITISKARPQKRKAIRWEVNSDGCWECISHYCDADGYSRIKHCGLTSQMHKYIYELCFGFVEKDLVVRHKCDNRRCINPEHLEVGTKADNIHDAIDRGRFYKYSGKFIGSTINAEDVPIIRSSKLSASELSKVYGVCKNTIYNVKSKTTWKHIL